MLPKLKEIIEKEQLNFWITSDNKVGTGLLIEHCDIETENFEDYANRLKSLLRTLHPNIIVKFELCSETSKSVSFHNSRAQYFESLSFKKQVFKLFVSILPPAFDFRDIKNTWRANKDFDNEIEELISFATKMENLGIKTTPLSKTELENFFKINYDLIKTTKSIESCSESIGVIRLVKQSPVDVSFDSLEEALIKIPDYKLITSIQRISETRAKIILEKRLKQLSSQKDVSSKIQSEETENSVKNQFSKGTQLFEFELLVVISRSSQSELSLALNQATSELNKFSDFKIEMYGLAESYIASHVASNQHVTLLESEECLMAFLPLFFKCDKSETVEKRSLSLFRKNQSLCHFDLFSSRYNCFNSLIIGTSGKGKSVLTGLLTQSLLFDANINVIKVDVGGSHSKECELFGGTEFKMKLDEPSGINPFSVISSKASESEKIGILSKFISVLILENGETGLSKEVRSNIEENIQAYILSSPRKPTLNDFFEKCLNFPRRNLLRRWVKGGIYEAAFQETEHKTLCNTRLQYYNFSQVFEASDPEFAQAGIAAVLAQFNIDSIEANGKRLVLICDETPFFIKTCFDFFKFSTANVRKYGHAVVLIGQLSTDFIVNGDHGIIQNSPQRFIFSSDGKPAEFKERLNLSDEKFLDIQSLKTIPRKYSEVFLQSNASGKILQIKITPEEYWTLTTSQPDQLKISKLREAVPHLKLSEALKCLSLF